MAYNRNNKKSGYDGSSLDDYVDVAERIQDFKDAYPDGSLQTLEWEIVKVEGHHEKRNVDMEQTYVVYRAAAFRTPEDERPGMGIAWEPWPGQTPYTAQSELMNAETAAWGRAVVALGLCANKKLASRQEVRARQDEQDAQPEVGEATTPRRRKKADPGPPTSGETEQTKFNLTQLRDAFTASGLAVDDLRWHLTALGVEDTSDTRAAMRSLTDEQRTALMAEFKKAADSKAAAAEADGQIPMEA